MSLFRRSIVITLASAAVAVLAGPLEAQSPIGKELSLSQLETHEPTAAFFPDGRFIFGFETVDQAGNEALRVKLFAQAGEPAAPEVVILQSPASRPADLAEARPVPETDGSFWTIWYELSLTRSGTFARHYSATGEPLAGALQLNRGGSFFPDSSLTTDGLLTVLGFDFNPDGYWPRVIERNTDDGSLVRDFNVDQPVHVVTPLSLFLESPETLFATWYNYTGDPQTSAVWGRRLTLDGASLGPPIIFNRRSQAEWANPEVARDGQGNFIAVWQAREKDGPYEDIYAQRVSASGARIGGIFVVNTIRASAQRFPTVAADRYGNFVIVWQSFDPAQGTSGWHLQGQLFRSDGRRVGREFVIPNPGGDNDTWSPRVVFGPNGTFLLHYVATGPVLVRRYAASPGDEACAWRGRTVQCDTGRTGEEAELTWALRLSPGDVPLMGDVDGDGRADPCVRRGRKFLCDTRHEGTLDWQVSFGQGGPGEIP